MERAETRFVECAESDSFLKLEPWNSKDVKVAVVWVGAPYRRLERNHRMAAPSNPNLTFKGGPIVFLE